MKFFQKMLILAFEANSTLSRENETKIVKITHSVGLYLARHGGWCLLVRHVALVLSREKIHLGRSSGMQSITFLASD